MEELLEVKLRDNFYLDGVLRVTILMVAIFLGIIIFIGLSLYFYFKQPVPVSFQVGEEWRVQLPVPVDQPYRSAPDLLQWVSDVIPRTFVFDFMHYNDQLKSYSQYFTPEGWKIFLNQLNIYANYTNVQTDKLFVNGIPAGAPFILNQGLLSGRYAWWVQMPININYVGGSKPISGKQLVLQILVVRVPTLNNLSGMGIDNILVANGAGTAR